MKNYIEKLIKKWSPKTKKPIGEIPSIPPNWEQQYYRSSGSEVAWTETVPVIETRNGHNYITWKVISTKQKSVVIQEEFDI